MEQIMLHKEEENKQKGMIVSFAVHALLLLLCLIPYMTREEEPKQISGIMVAFGLPEGGAGDIAPTTNESESKPDTKPAENKSESDAKKSTAPVKQEKITKPKEASKPIDKVVAVQKESEIVAKDAQEKADKAKADAEEAEKARQQAAELAKIAAQKKADQDAKIAAQKAKSDFGDLFGQGSGDNNSTGNQGKPNGDPNSDALDQIATGSGRIGGGLSDRGVIFEPKIEDNSQKTGKVVIKVCVDPSGKVSEAKFTQRNSTTTDKYLVDIATKAAKQYQFTPSEVETQCGTITIEFKVR